MAIHLTPAEEAAVSKRVIKLSAFEREIAEGLVSKVPLGRLQPMPITFEYGDRGALLDDGDVIDAAFFGVTFSSFNGGHAYARKPMFVPAHSGTHVVSVDPPATPPHPQSCAFGEPDGIEAVFSVPQRHVYVWAYPLQLPEGGLGPTSYDTPYLKAYDAHQNLLHEASCPLLVDNGPPAAWYQLVVGEPSGTANIASVRLSASKAHRGGLPVEALFDDFAFFA